jgi:CrcB protein
LQHLLIIGIGGFIGAIFRYLISGVVQDFSKSIHFPYGTMSVNLLGCFIIGLLIHLVEYRGMFSPEVRLFVFLGLLGSFTTFSTFALETNSLLNDVQWLQGFTNILVTNVLGLAMVFAGRGLSQIIWR